MKNSMLKSMDRSKKMTIGIIGFGRFGKLAASLLKGHFSVKVCGLNINDNDRRIAKRVGIEINGLAEAVNSDIVILAVPISETQKMIRKIAPMLRPGTLAVDTCSVKTFPCQWMKKHLPKNIEIMGTHPMFGPMSAKFDFKKQAWNIKGLQIVLCPLRIDNDRLEIIVKNLKRAGLEVIVTTPDDHDRQNAVTLGLVHFLGRSLKEAGIKEQKIYTPGFADLLKISPHTTGDNWQLFYDMHNFNPYADKVRAGFLGACSKIEQKIERSREKDSFKFYRNMISKLDFQIFQLLKQRFGIVKRIGQYKKRNGLAVRDRKREEELIEKQISQIKLNPQFIKNLYKLIFKESVRRQK